MENHVKIMELCLSVATLNSCRFTFYTLYNGTIDTFYHYFQAWAVNMLIPFSLFIPVNRYFGKQCRPRWNAALCGILSGSALLAKITRNCVYETLCPQPLACWYGWSHHPFHKVTFFIYSECSISWPNLRLQAVIVFRNIFIISLIWPDLQRAITWKNVKGNNSKK